MKLIDSSRGRGLYLITDAACPNLVERTAEAIAGGTRIVQYRDMNSTPERRLEQARALRKLTLAAGIPLLIDHDLGLAYAVHADGVHLGQQDDDIAAARALLGNDSIVGVSCYGSLQQMQRFAREGASYVSVGAFFPSPTKPAAAQVSIDLLRQSANLGIPRVAIGGITPDNAEALIDAGADYVAAISAIYQARDVRAVAQRFTGLYATFPGNTP